MAGLIVYIYAIAALGSAMGVMLGLGVILMGVMMYLTSVIGQFADYGDNREFEPAHDAVGSAPFTDPVIEHAEAILAAANPRTGEPQAEAAISDEEFRRESVGILP